MLHTAIRVVANILLALSLLWAGSKDYCLVVSLSPTATPDVGMAVLGFALQVLGIVAIYSLMNGSGGYFRRVIELISNRSLKAVLLVLPFAFLLMSHHVIALGLYSAGVNKKIASAHNAEAALRDCSTLGAAVPGFGISDFWANTPDSRAAQVGLVRHDGDRTRSDGARHGCRDHRACTWKVATTTSFCVAIIAKPSS